MCRFFHTPRFPLKLKLFLEVGVACERVHLSCASLGNDQARLVYVDPQRVAGRAVGRVEVRELPGRRQLVYPHPEGQGQVFQPSAPLVDGEVVIYAVEYYCVACETSRRACGARCRGSADEMVRLSLSVEEDGAVIVRDLVGSLGSGLGSSPTRSVRRL